jgi:hypothetical protein
MAETQPVGRLGRRTGRAAAKRDGGFIRHGRRRVLRDVPVPAFAKDSMK